MSLELPIQALREEIGLPQLFTGRAQDLTFFIEWVALVRRELGQSQVILARKRRGKTALVQRLYNLLYSQNDPKIIPFYIRIDEGRTTQLAFSIRLLSNLLSQYLAFIQRRPELVGDPLNLEELSTATDDPVLLRQVKRMQQYKADNDSIAAWDLARELGHTLSTLKDVRIIQIIDEFQFLNDRVYVHDDYLTRIELGNFYQRTGSSKVSPQIITGSYIGWLSQIVDRMVGRYEKHYLKPLDSQEALAAVYNYSSVLGRPVNDASAAYMVEACFGDPYYISQTFKSKCPNKDLTRRETIREILEFETGVEGGIHGMWMDYLVSAFSRINDKDGKRIVLYLAHQGGEERTRRQIRDDLKLEMDDGELEKKTEGLHINQPNQAIFWPS